MIITNSYDPKLKITRKNLLCSDSFTFYQTSIHNLDNIHHEFDVAINLAAQPGVEFKKIESTYTKQPI